MSAQPRSWRSDERGFGWLALIGLCAGVLVLLGLLLWAIVAVVGAGGGIAIVGGAIGAALVGRR